MLHIKNLGFDVSDLKYFFMFPYKSLIKTCDPGRAHFWSQGA